MKNVLQRPYVTIPVLLLLAAGPVAAAPQAPPPPPSPTAPGQPDLPEPPEFDIGHGDFHLHEGDLEVEVERHGPAVVTVVRGPRSYVGVTLLDLTPELRELYTGSKESGVLVSSVEPDSPAAKAGLRVGDVIVKVGGESVSRSQDVSRPVRRKEAGQKITFEVRRDKAARTFEVTVAERTGSRREIRVPDYGRHGFSFRTDDWEERMSERVERALERTQEKLRQIEERLRELERRWQAK